MEYGEASIITLEGWKDGKLGLYCHVLNEGVYLELTPTEVHDLILKLVHTLPFGLQQEQEKLDGEA